VTPQGNDAADASRDEIMDAVRNIGVRVSDDLHAWLTELARREHRSLNGEIVWLLERAREQVERQERDRETP
jgi:hypothetical protein